jgi:hypothetical protein
MDILIRLFILVTAFVTSYSIYTNEIEYTIPSFALLIVLVYTLSTL